MPRHAPAGRSADHRAALPGDRGDSENHFDELKNPWGWAGFPTHDRNRCQVMARIPALIYNWWTVLMRLGIPDQHAEAITSRPLALHGIARQTRHSNQTKGPVPIPRLR